MFRRRSRAIGNRDSALQRVHRDFPGGPVAPNAGGQVQSLVRELDPTCLSRSSHATAKDPTGCNED